MESEPFLSATTPPDTTTGRGLSPSGSHYHVVASLWESAASSEPHPVCLRRVCAGYPTGDTIHIIDVVHQLVRVLLFSAQPCLWNDTVLLHRQVPIVPARAKSVGLRERPVSPLCLPMLHREREAA